MNSASISRFLLIIGLIYIYGIQEARAQSSELVGPVSESEILSADRIFEIYVDRYRPDSSAVEYVKNWKEPVNVIIFFGTWCRDSKKYIPGFMKLMRTAAPENIEVEYIGVDAQKKFPGKFLKKFNIKYIPSVVVLNGDSELGRIEEKPQKPIELAFVEILKKAEKID